MDKIMDNVVTDLNRVQGGDNDMFVSDDGRGMTENMC